MKKTILIVCIIFVAVSFSPAMAAFIIDTGEPQGANYGFLPEFGMASKFSIENPYILTAIHGFMTSGGGALTLAIYKDGGLVPDITQQVFSSAFDLLPSDDRRSWQGLSNLSFKLLPNSYWIAFESRIENTYIGSMALGAPNPLEFEAVGFFNSPVRYHPEGNVGLGIKIQGHPIPIPGAIWLLGSGIIATLGLKKKTTRRKL